MSSQLKSQEEFFIYVPLLQSAGSLNREADSRGENTLVQPVYEDWLKIPLAERVVVYAHVRDEEECYSFSS